MDIRIYNHLLLFLGAFCITLALTACGNSGSGESNNDLGNNIHSKDNSVALRVAVPDSIRNSFCAKFEVTNLS